jgi:hypothetical protein
MISAIAQSLGRVLDVIRHERSDHGVNDEDAPHLLGPVGAAAIAVSAVTVQNVIASRAKDALVFERRGMEEESVKKLNAAVNEVLQTYDFPDPSTPSGQRQANRKATQLH